MADVEASDTEAAVKTDTTASAVTSSVAAKGDMESRIEVAMQSRLSHFNQQANSLTLEGVRRLLEEDLGLEEFALDPHKRFIKHLLLKSLEGAADENVPKDSEDVKGNHVWSTGEAAETGKRIEEASDDAELGTEDSPIMGLLTDQKKKSTKLEKEGTRASENKILPNESIIKKAMLKRASYLRANSITVTMAGVRRLLEEDLKLDKHALDPFKKFITSLVDEILVASDEKSEPKKRALKKSSQSEASKKVSCDERSNSLDEERDEDDEVEAKPKKRNGPKQKIQDSEGLKKRKRPEKESKLSSKKQTKPVEVDNNDAEDDDNASEDGNSQSSAEKPVKKKEKKEVATPAYGKHVEHLKSVIKSCGMSVPPVIYKKIKQVPENKRENQLIKELEEILSREGLSPHPSEKEIKEVRKRKERAKELEGIDTGNIVLSSRRRSTSSYAPPPKPKLPVESEESSDDEDGDEDEDDDDGDEGDNSDEDNNGDNDEGDGSQSEESEKEQGEDSD